MKQTLTLLSAFVLLQAGQAMAKPKHLQIPQSALPAGVSAEVINRKLRQIDVMHFGNPGTANKTTAAERMNSQSDYDYTQAPGAQFLDSLSFIYSNGRGSAFDIVALEYDIYNSSSIPSPVAFGNPYINFDSVRSYSPPGSSSSSVIWLRNYNAAGKVVRDENANEVDLFVYNISNKITKMTGIQYNSTSGSWDSSYRDFYKYNGAGYLIQDSSEYYDESTLAWTPQFNYNYTNDVSGRPIRVNVDFPIGGGITLTVARLTTTYSGATSNPTSILVQALNSSTFMLENNQKDSIAYVGTAPSLHESYSWDTTAMVWNLEERELRRLNAAGMPDSVSYKSYSAGKAVDSAYSKLGYNSQNNPTYRRDYEYGTANPQSEIRWYYGPVEAAGVGKVSASRLDFYPNPVTDKIQVKGLTEGNYMIHNTAGQLLQSGKLQSSGTIPVQFLIPGMYTLSIQDAKGQPFTATFIRQ